MATTIDTDATSAVLFDMDGVLTAGMLRWEGDPLVRASPSAAAPPLRSRGQRGRDWAR